MASERSASAALPDGLDPVIVWSAWNTQPGLGPSRAAGWLRAAGSLAEAVAAARRGRVAGLPPGVADAVRRAMSDASLRRAEDAVTRWRRQVDDVVALGTAAYPAALAELADPAPLLYVRGRLPACFRAADGLPAAVAVVGTRRATPWATAFARDLGRDLAAGGLVVVSGLALGVDGAAHRGALDGRSEDATGDTVAVLAGGLDAVHPPAHAALAERIAATGALLSEHPPGVQPHKGAFPRRNRLITGLVAAVAVVEAPYRSGVRHTVAVAAEAGRDVWVVPQRPDTEVGRAAAALLADGAAPLTGADDLLTALGIRSPGAASGEADAAAVATDPTERAILRRLHRSGPATNDELGPCGATPIAVLAALARLEARRSIRRDGSGRWRLG